MARILVVDDEEADRVGLTSVLESVGHEVRSAAGTDEALKLYMREPIHLVVTDIVMPNEDGLDLISALRNINPEMSIIAVSGKSPVGLQVAETVGALRVLTKPVDRAELLAVVRAALEPTGVERP